MQPNDDFRQEDAQLRELLREWPAPPAPDSLEARVLPPQAVRERRAPWWRFLLNGYIRVPVPVACCVMVVMLFAAWRLVKPAGPAPCAVAAQPRSCTFAVPGMC